MYLFTQSMDFSFDTKQWVLDYILGYAKAHLISALRDGIKTGSLCLIDRDEYHIFGVQRPELESDKTSAEITVLNDKFWLRVFAGHDVGFSEAYMHGDFETPNLKAILDLWLDNRAHLGNLYTFVSRLSSVTSALALRLFGQSLSNAKLNVITGYDCSNDLFKTFLSEDMMYSAAMWPERLGGVRGDLEQGPFPGDLEAAQLEKIHHVLRKARVRPGDRLLEFGSGWGALAIEAAKLGCSIDTLTLSVQQKVEAEERIRNAGFESRITVHLMDYRQLPKDFEKAFDAFVCVEMVEHVGLKYHDQFFKIVDWALKSDRGTAVISATTQPEWRYSTFQPTDYSRRYQWPNAFCPSPTAFICAAQKAVPGGFALEAVEDHSHYYPRTLREWGRRFQKNWNMKTIASLLKSHPHLADDDNIEVFRRKWEYLFVYAEIGFARAYTSVHYFTFVRPENVLMRCD